MSLRSIIITAALSVAASTCAAAGFGTPVLSSMAEAMRLTSVATLPADTTMLLSGAVNGRTVKVRTDSNGSIGHIGYPLFSPEVAKALHNPRLTDFVERYLLQLDLRLNDISPARQMDADQVVIIDGELPMLSSLTEETPVSIRKIARRSFMISWQLPAGNLTLSVPADCQLLLGADAPQLEEMLIASLARTHEPAPRDFSQLLADTGHTPPVALAGNNGTVILEGNPYLSDLIRSDIYIADTPEGMRLYANPANPSRTIPNIMLTGEAGRPLQVELTVDRYGHRSERIDTTLGKFLSFCRTEGCEFYFGIKAIDKEKLSGTLFALNNDMAYNHVLSVEFPLSILQGATHPIKAVLYAYIPLQNVTERFFNQSISPKPQTEKQE